MSTENWLTGIVCLGLMIYLLFALIRPEMF
jgi:K+-transporting ATPase KdpF subunit